MDWTAKVPACPVTGVNPVTAQVALPAVCVTGSVGGSGVVAARTGDLGKSVLAGHVALPSGSWEAGDVDGALFPPPPCFVFGIYPVPTEVALLVMGIWHLVGEWVVGVHAAPFLPAAQLHATEYHTGDRCHERRRSELESKAGSSARASQALGPLRGSIPGGCLGCYSTLASCD